MAIPLERLFEGFLLAKQAEGVSPLTIDTYKLMYHNLERDLPPNLLSDPTAIRVTDLQAWIVGLRERIATATLDQRIAKCKTFFRWCHKQGFLENNPTEDLKRPREDWQPDPLNENEIQTLLKVAKKGRQGPRNYAIVCLFLDSGLRASELCKLRPEDVSIKTGQQVKVIKGKMGKSRTVLVGNLAKEALWHWLIVRPKGATHLFCTEQGNPLRRDRVRRIVFHLGEKIGIRCYPHRLRHTFALQYLKFRGDPYSLQYLLGHEDMTMTKRYVKIAAQDVSEMYHSPLDSLEG
jgi:integrase/recombinase XerD